MKFLPTPLPGLTLVQTQPHADVRGRFVRVFGQAEFFPLRPHLGFVQVNLSLTRGRGSLRGLHFQRPPAAEAKLIRCLRGRVFDVAVDLRAGSPTCLRWHAMELDEASEQQIFIPEGFAHGFQALTEEVELLYQHTAPYRPDCEGGLRFDDPRLGIRWPLPPVNVSARDQALPVVDAGFEAIAS
jgi:dTDP-4-dehydrorhamnose 3,5-epimerase